VLLLSKIWGSSSEDALDICYCGGYQNVLLIQLAQHEEDIAKGNKPAKALGLDPTVDDFKRELLFHRQAQAAVTHALPKLKALGVKTRRPEDYFAEMAKSDSHMQKVSRLQIRSPLILLSEPES